MARGVVGDVTVVPWRSGATVLPAWAIRRQAHVALAFGEYTGFISTDVTVGTVPLTSSDVGA